MCHFSERDHLDRDLMESKKSNTFLDAALKSKTENLLEVQKEVSQSNYNQ